MPSAQAGELNLYSMNTGSYVYHMTGNHGQYNEHFNNNFFSVELQVFLRIQNTACWSEPMKNSFDDRCLTLGVRRDWLKKRYRLGAERGVCLLPGIFFDAFQPLWGFRHLPHRQKNHRRRFFAPTSIMVCNITSPIISGVEGGIIAPAIFVMSIQWSFR